ncbi:MAG: hypothetical protein ACFFCQ_04545 [Promethearchaeota archaeon]
MSADTVLIEFIRNDQTAKITLKRHLAPSTVATLKRMLSDKDLILRAVIRGGEFQFPIRIGRVGKEKPVREVKAGSVVYSPQATVLSVFGVDASPIRPVNLLGKTDDLEFFKNLHQGTAVKIRLK